MPKNLTDLRSRLRDVSALNGVSLPGHVLAFQKFHLVAMAHGAVLSGREKWVSRYMPKSLVFLQEASHSAKHDLSALGYEPTSAMVESYLDQFCLWPFTDFSADDLARAAKKAEADAPPEILELLPSDSRTRAHAKHPSSKLQPDAYQIWQREIQFVVRARIMHERALTARKEYFHLSGSTILPSTAVHLEGLHRGLSALTRHAARIGTRAIHRVIGASAAYASQWRLDCLRWQLEVADMELLPLGSYLSAKSDPKQLGIWYIIDSRLRSVLGGTLSGLAVSRIVAASLIVYAGQRLVPARDVGNFARNAVEKWRKRMAPDLATGTLERFPIDDAVAKVVRKIIESANGQATLRATSQKPKQRLRRQSSALSRRPSP